MLWTSVLVTGLRSTSVRPILELPLGEFTAGAGGFTTPTVPEAQSLSVAEGTPASFESSSDSNLDNQSVYPILGLVPTIRNSNQEELRFAMCIIGMIVAAELIQKARSLYIVIGLLCLCPCGFFITRESIRVRINEFLSSLHRLRRSPVTVYPVEAVAITITDRMQG